MTEGVVPGDAAADLKRLNKEREKLMMLSMTNEKAMRAREDELIEKTHKLEIVVKKMKKELIEARTLKQYFLLQDRVLNQLRKDNPTELAHVYAQLGITPEKVAQLNEVTKKMKANSK